MQSWNTNTNQEPEETVDAIEEGKIVKVSINYAKKEGLPILRKHEIPSYERPTRKMVEPEERITLDDLRKPLNDKNQVLSELIENFHWEISKKRRQIGLSRKQLALSIKEPESSLKLIENGIMPRDDFVIINKIQERLKINLRKDKQDFSQPARKLIDQEKEKIEHSSKTTKILGDDIELYTEDSED